MAPEEDGFDVENAAAVLRANLSDVHVLLKALSEQLADALGPRFTAKRAGGRFRKSEELESVHVVFDAEQFDVEVTGANLRCSIGKVSGGIKIKTEQVDPATWINRLVGALHAEAMSSDATRLALERLIIGGTP